MSQLESNQEPAGEHGKGPQEDNQDQARDNPNDCQTGWETEHAIADNLGNHQHGNELP